MQFNTYLNFYRVLILDENQEIHHDLQRFLNAQNLLPTLKIDNTQQSNHAIEMILRSVQEDQTYAIAFLDLLSTSNFDCVKTIKDIWQIDPNVQIVICAAQSGMLWEKLVASFGIIDNLIVIQKPFDAIMFQQVVCALVKKWEVTIAKSMQQKLFQAQLEKTENQFKHAVTHDPITDLPNRFLLLDRINKEIANAYRMKKSFAIIQINIDRFNLINDSLGRNVGDQVLKGLSIRLNALTTELDATLAKAEADEFIILCEKFTDEKEIVTHVEKQLKMIQAPFNINHQEFSVTACAGIALYPRDGEKAETLLQNVDTALHKAKSRGPNTYQFYASDMTLNGLVQLKIENQMRKAIENKQFALYYQPQIDLLTGRCYSVEALVRWNHPERGLLLPDHFISIAEQSGLIVPLGEWILKTACQQNYQWQQMGFKPVRIAVNISRQQFETDQLIPTIKAILAETHLPAHLLELELSENMIISNQNTIDKICELKKLGVAIALDDFGTGYSSLCYLKKIPLDRIKIDKSFIKNINISPDDEAFIRAIIAIARSLNLQVTAEGVESEMQTQFLLDNQCHEVQGFLFGRGLDAKQTGEYLKKFDLHG